MRVIPGGGEGPSEEDIIRGLAKHVHYLERMGRSRETAIAEVAELVADYSIKRGFPRAVVMPRALDRVRLALALEEDGG